MLYSKHIADCNQFAQSGADELARTLGFVLATIQQRLEHVPGILEDYREHGSDSRHAWGSKGPGLDFIRDYAPQIHSRAMAYRDDPRRLLGVFLEVPGLGLVKAGFACQLFAGTVGCIDTHNIKVYDIPLKDLRYSDKLLPTTQHRKQQQYVDLCHGLGGSEFLWGGWCEYLANLRPEVWQDGATVSRFHVTAIQGG